jgi:DNA-binding response OmpR family regulator
MRVLLVEDSDRLRQYLEEGLAQAGFSVDTAPDGEEGLWLALSNDYDVIILDLMLPKMNGLTLLRKLREKGRTTHVLILTARDTVPDRVRGLEEGGDDYLVKPFALEELIARVQALARRSYGVKSSVITVGDLQIDTSRRTATFRDHAIDLTRREFALLEYLAMRPGQVVTRTEIESHIYDEQADPMSNVVDSAIYRLRKKIEAAGRTGLIRTRRGMGYVLEDPGT